MSGKFAYNKLLNFVPATKSVASTGLPTLRCGSQLAKRYMPLSHVSHFKCHMFNVYGDIFF